MPAIEGVKALAWDVGGTVFDWHHTIKAEVAALAQTRGAPVDAARFANDWRRRQFELLAQVRSRVIPWANGDELYRRALDDILEKQDGLSLNASERDALNEVWHRQRAWPDAAAPIAALRNRYTVVVLTVFSWAIVVDSSRHAGISWDGVLSCEFLGAYKPDPESYRECARLLRLKPAEVMMVAAHPSDLRAAMAAGLRSAYVPRPGERGDGFDGDLSPQPDFDINASDFPDLARQLLD